MEFALIIWLISSLSNIAYFLGWFAFLCLIGAVMSTIVYGESRDEKLEKSSAFWAKTLLVICIVSAFTATILPSTKTGWMMAGAYTAQTALQSESAKKVGAIVEIKLQEALDEVTEQAKIKAK